MQRIENIILELCKKYEQNYGFAVFDLSVEEKEREIVISGDVLTEKQKEEVLLKAREISEKNIKDEINVLSDIPGKEIGWATVQKDFAELKSRFVENAIINDKILKRIRSSQAEQGEILRVILRKSDQLLVQQKDMTLGWINCDAVDFKKESLKEQWQRGFFAKPGELITVDKERETIISEAKKYLGTVYILGAKSDKALDCSGLVQQVYKNVFDIILPKHSWDQKKMGIAVDFSEAQTGDLVFMINEETDTKHVGILELADDGKKIIHASFSEGKVVRQPAEEVFEKYKLMETRSVIEN